ncbi:hypothetical protein [Lysinibacillus xylanilyticus]|uniref:hypothetical protein n=1 Tax=Lysinibacillus xylanilyticus TaxID=582475 RepID=UPI0038094841
MKGMNYAGTIQNPDALFICSESKATATNVYCAKAKRQRQMFTARKRSGSGKCLLRESEAAAANVFCSESEAAAAITPRRN